MAVDYQKEGRIAIFTINRPEAMNSLNAEAHRELSEAMIDFQNDNDLWVGIITGAGEKAFCAGQDIRGGGAGSMAAYNLADKIWKPFIAAINGYALGGGLEIALTCDIRIAAENARLGLPEVLRGMNAGAGGMQRLSRFIPRAIVSWMVLSGQQIDAQEAYRIGLVNKVVPLEQLMSTARELAETICQAAPLATRIGKEVIIRGYDMTLEQSLQLQRDVASRHGGAEDRMEGVKAFAEKRKPVWQAK
ncbi:MAG: enoyl-CoA hydratase/isomerase family protein [Chloroflexi bacterium]|nr:enoyl-CoA hydratase/isomerase family protein [Chloroflexota bacterium]